MAERVTASIEAAKQAAVKVLRHNARGPCQGLFRAAGWGYPEPYTRDVMLSAFGILVSEDEQLIGALRDVLVALAEHQTERGHIPSLAHDPDNRGASDTTPLFLIGLALFRRATGEAGFLDEAAGRALTWMQYQSPEDRILVAQQPTSDWRDEHWVLGYGLYVNVLVYIYLRLYGRDDDAETLRHLINRLDVHRDHKPAYIREGLAVPRQPYYALWSHKVDNNERFDLLGNALAMLSGIASSTRCQRMIAWVEANCEALRREDALYGALPPCLFPYMHPGDSDWRPRYATYNPPGTYHNGGVWPFISGFYIAALVGCGRCRLAERKLAALAEAVRPARHARVAFGFNEWLDAHQGRPCGQDWQTWSAALFLYAARCVEEQRTFFFDDVRTP